MSTKAKTKTAKKAVDHAAKAAEYLEGWQRARAELDNFRKQSALQNSTAREHGMIAALTALLPLHDNLQSVIAHVPKELASDSWTAGVLHVARQFATELEALGVTQIAAVGEAFDPARHEAVAKAKTSKKKSNTIVEVVQPGYILGDHVLRPAKVKVAQ